MSDVTRLDLLRHGETTAGHCFLGATDAPLSEKGWRQMHSATQGKRYQKIVCSPLARCAEFARQLAQTDNLSLTIENDFREINFGDWEAKTTQQVWASHEKLLKKFWYDPVKNTPPNGESYAEFNFRLTSVVEKIIKQYHNEHVLLIVHGGVIRNIISNVLSIPFKKSLQVRIDYAGLSRIDCYDESKSVGFINQRIESSTCE
jgi:alpha-ribazole phosphatase